MLSALGTLIGQWNSGFHMFYDEHENVYRLFFALLTVRIFLQTSSTRNIIFIFLKIAPIFKDLMILLLLVVYIYGMVGTQMLSNQFQLLPDATRPTTNFDHLSNSILALLQMLVKDVGSGYLIKTGRY